MVRPSGSSRNCGESLRAGGAANATDLHERVDGPLGHVQITGPQVGLLVHGGARVHEEQYDAHSHTIKQFCASDIARA